MSDLKGATGVGGTVAGTGSGGGRVSVAHRAGLRRGRRTTSPAARTPPTPLSPAIKGKGCPYSTAERRVPELIPVLGSQPAGEVSHKPAGRLPLLSARPAVTPETLKRAATNFAAW